MRRVWEGVAAVGNEVEREEVVERATKERRERVTDLEPRDAIGDRRRDGGSLGCQTQTQTLPN